MTSLTKHRTGHWATSSLEQWPPSPERREELIERKLRRARLWRRVAFGAWLSWIVIGVAELVIADDPFAYVTIGVGLLGLIHQWHASRTYSSPERLRERFEEELAAQSWRP